MSKIQEVTQALRNSISQVILGKENVVDKLLAALLCGGHVLLNDIPGTGKTTLARTLAQSMEATFRRIQFTPDLMPSDLVGVSIFDPAEKRFVFREGAVFTQILLADEINRATPRTQSALLECMEEHQVTVDGTTYPLDALFFVIATQNPVEMEGTFPLPEAQLDRFLLCLSLGYPEREQELALLSRPMTMPVPVPVISAQQIVAARRELEQVAVSRAVQEYLADLTQASRQHPQVQLGLSTRGMLDLLRVSKAFAAMQGRSYVIPDDIKHLAADSMAHRMQVQGNVWTEQSAVCRQVVQELLEQVPVPKETAWNC